MLTIQNLDVAKELNREERAAVRGGNQIALKIPYPSELNDSARRYPGMSEKIPALTPTNAFPQYVELPPRIEYSPEHGLISPQ